MTHQMTWQLIHRDGLGDTIAADTAAANKNTFKLVYNPNEIQLYLKYTHSCADSLNVKTLSNNKRFSLLNKHSSYPMKIKV